MRVLVGILKSDEKEFDSCIDALKWQTFKGIDYFYIDNLPNKKAHDTLYQRFMNHSSSFDYFLKLDADMVFSKENSLEQMLGVFRSDVAHLFAYVFDVPSSIKIPGIQMFRSDTIWGNSDEQLNVDYPPKLNGDSISIVDCDWVNHMPSPSNYQLFRYGIHKALKSIQPDRGNKNAKKGILHAAILNGIARNYFSGRKELCWSLIGAMLVYSRQIAGVEYNSSSNRSLFIEIEQNGALREHLIKEAQCFWMNEIQSLFRWLDLFQTERW